MDADAEVHRVLTESEESVWRADRSDNLSDVTTERRRRDAPVKVYGIAEIARALDTDPGLVGKWRERHKLPAPDAELATGPVWLAGTIEPLLAAGGPEPRTPGQRLRKFVVTARMTAGLYPALTNDRRSFFQAAIAATHQSDDLEPPVVLWDMLDEATVTMACEAHEASAAAEIIRSVIRKSAELVAHVGVREIDIISISPAD
jgi:hypothetical protein